MVRTLYRTEFQESRNFDIEIDGAPDDLSLYVVDISYGPVEFESEEGKTGMKKSNSLVAVEPVTITITVRDKMENGRFKLRKWFEEWAAMVFNRDGTFNLPRPGAADSYVKKYRRFTVSDESDSRIQTEEYDVLPQKLGEITESRAEGKHLEYPFTIIQYESF